MAETGITALLPHKGEGPGQLSPFLSQAVFFLSYTAQFLLLFTGKMITHFGLKTEESKMVTLQYHHANKDFTAPWSLKNKGHQPPRPVLCPQSARLRPVTGRHLFSLVPRVIRWTWSDWLVFHTAVSVNKDKVYVLLFVFIL